MQTRGLIFDIKKFAIHDGPGVRTTVFFKGCPLRCAWCCNPESQLRSPELVWIRDRCLGCDLCLSTCKEGALGTAPGGKKSVDPVRCTRCGACAASCPREALNLIGKSMTVDEVLAEIEKDALYYEASGGGLTLSGGEPLAQPDFAAELLHRYKHEEKGNNTAVETCGSVAWTVLERIARDVDLFLYDLKHMDTGEHLRLTGEGNRTILENAQNLARAGCNVVIRLPLIPGFNDDSGNLEATAAFVRALPGVFRIDILPYHRLGEPKHARLNREYALRGVPPPEAVGIERARQILAAHRLEVTVGG